MITIKLSGPFRESGKGELSVEAATVNDALTQLNPTLQTKLFKNGCVNRFVNVFLNDENIQHLQDLVTPVKDGDVITLLPSIAGG